MDSDRALKGLTPNDREEVEAFRELLADMGKGLRGDALWDKYGEGYLGPKPMRAAEIGREPGGGSNG